MFSVYSSSDQINNQTILIYGCKIFLAGNALRNKLLEVNVRVMNYSDYTNKVDVNSMKQTGVLKYVLQRTKQEFTSCVIYQIRVTFF